MAKCIPYEKVSKKKKRKIAQTRRQAWGELNPVTRNRRSTTERGRRIGRGNFQTCVLIFILCPLRRKIPLRQY